MAIEITVPRLGWTMEEATFACWLKKEGEKVSAGEPLLTIEGDKSLQEIESMDAGILHLIPGSPNTGDTVKVGQLLGYLLAEGEKLPTAANNTSAPAAELKPKAEKAAPVSEKVSAPTPVAVPVLEPVRTVPSDAAASTPRARRASAELGVDITQVTGSGTGGRVRERDVRGAVGHSAPAPAPIVASGGQDVPVTTMRRTIADRMMQSLANTAPVTLTCRVDATNLVALRSQFKASKDEVVVPAYTDIVAKLAASTITRLPAISGQWKGDRIVLPNPISIGIAVDTEYGLIVPVIHDVPSLTLAQVARRSRELIDLAYARKLKPADFSGGVFTLTNLGSFGIDAFTPIINQPETAILGLGAIRREPCIMDGKNIVPRDLMTISLTFDHRVLDGAPAARFLQALGQAIENPVLCLVEPPFRQAG